MNGNEVRSATFPFKYRGYSSAEVDDRLERIAEEIDSSQSPANLIREARFSRPFKGYSTYSVDRFIDAIEAEQSGATAQVRSAEPRRAWTKKDKQDQVAKWKQFPRLPGTQLRWQRLRGMEGYRGQLVLPDGTIIASSSKARHEPMRITIEGGRTYEPNVLVTRQDRGLGRKRVDGETEWIDRETQQPLFRINGTNFDYKSSTVVLLPDRRRFTFPVFGPNRRCAVMMAIDQSRDAILHYRCTGNRAFEVVVNPNYELSPELACVIAVTWGQVRWYFSVPGG